MDKDILRGLKDSQSDTYILCIVILVSVILLCVQLGCSYCASMSEIQEKHDKLLKLSEYIETICKDTRRRVEYIDDAFFQYRRSQQQRQQQQFLPTYEEAIQLANHNSNDNRAVVGNINDYIILDVD